MNFRTFRPLALPLAALLWSGLAASAAVNSQASGKALEAMMAAEFAREGGDLTTAALWTLEAASAVPDPVLAARAAESALAAGDAIVAAAALERWTVLEPQSTARDRLALRFHVFQGDDDQALVVALRMLARPEGLVDVTQGLEARYPDQGVLARAVLRALRFEPEFPRRVDAWLAMAGLAQRLGDGTLSAQWIDGLIERFPNDPRAGLLQAERLSANGDREGARRAVEKVLALPNLPLEERRIAAESLAVLGDPEGAATALARGAQDPRSLALRSAWLVQAGDLVGLRQLFVEAQALATPARTTLDPAWALMLGRIAERLQDWPAAERWYRSLTQGEARSRAQLRLGLVLSRQRRYEDALAVLRELQSDDEADGVTRREAYIAESDLFESRRRRADAVSTLTRGLVTLEDDPALLVARARVARNDGRHDDAEADLTTVLLRDPRNPPALRALGALMLARGQPAQAEPLFARAWAVARRAPTAAAWGESLWLLGRTEEARAAWRLGVAVDPADPVLADTMERYGQ